MSKRLLIVLIIFAVDVFGAFAWLFYTETPGYVLAEARRRMAGSTGIKFEVNAAGEGTAVLSDLIHEISSGNTVSGESKTGAFTLQATTLLDLADLGAVKRSDEFNLAITSSSTAPARYQGKAIFANSRRLLRFSGLPDLGRVSEAFVGTWVELPPDSLDYVFLRPSADATLGVGADQKLRSLFRAAKFLKPLGEFSETSINNRRQFHYQVALRPEALRTFLVIATGLREERSPTAEELTRLDSDLARFDFKNIEVWIDKGNYFLSRFLIQGMYANSETGTSLPFSATVNLTALEPPVGIESPKTGVTLRSLLAGLRAAGLTLAFGRTENSVASAASSTPTGLATSLASDVADDDPDKDGLSNLLESFYGTDPANPDSDGDGYMDGYEVNHGFNPMGPGELFRFGS